MGLSQQPAKAFRETIKTIWPNRGGSSEDKDSDDKDSEDEPND